MVPLRSLRRRRGSALLYRHRTHDLVCTAERAPGIENLLLSRQVNVTLEFMPGAVHMDQNLDNNFYAYAAGLERESRVWQWVQSVLDGSASAAPESYQLTYDDARKPAAEEKKMIGLEPLATARTKGWQSTAATYQIQPGDTLWKIVSGHLGSGVRRRELYELNRDQIKDPNRTFAGQVLALPQQFRIQPKGLAACDSQAASPFLREVRPHTA